MAETESWRQYVPLAVSALVILDILLGSPAANSVMDLMRAQENDDDAEAPRSEKRQTVVNTAERVDSMAVAQAAIDKANATLELKRFLEEQKTDWDKMEDIRKKMDRQMQELDEKIKEQREQS
jgi:predicted RNase H-like nuclease (RuvC/YqgF family)